MGRTTTRRREWQRRIVPYHDTGTPRTFTPEERVLEMWQRASEADRQRMERSPEFMKRLRDAQGRRKSCR